MPDKNKIKLLILWDILCKNTDENHAMNADEIREELAKRGISVIRRVVADDIAALNKYGYEVLSYKKKYYYYYVVNRPLDTAEVVLLADALKSSKLSARQKNALIEKLSGLLCSYQAQSVSKHLISVADEKQSGASIIYNVDVIERAIDENKQISFLYFDYDSYFVCYSHLCSTKKLQTQKSTIPTKSCAFLLSICCVFEVERNL